MYAQMYIHMYVHIHMYIHMYIICMYAHTGDAFWRQF